jgi:hypothetical protein
MFASEHACDQWHSSRKYTPLTGLHCKLRPNTEGATPGASVFAAGWVRLYCFGCAVRVFRPKSTLEDAIGSHACSLEDLACV